MTEKEFLDKYHIDVPIYEQYGNYIKDEIVRKAKEENIPDSWFIIEPTSRVKDEKSLLEKAFYRGKGYADPYNDITDKVGVRFVLLTTNQVTSFTKVIEKIENFICRKDRDYEREQEQNPTIFIYQSMHYIISLKNVIKCNGITIPTGIYCEVQIRTLLQHAYSELTHDTIYKPKTVAEPRTHRLVARSMALIETTDVIFSEVSTLVGVEKNRNEIVINSIEREYSNKIKFEKEDKMCNLILDFYRDNIPTFNQIYDFINEKPYIIVKINERSESKLLFRQPVILLLYYIIDRNQYLCLKKWPFTVEEIEPIYTDLGISIPNL
jgi:ppGpp synthetase/RelA/SpoT-type nucleotidyltranferase